MNLKRAFNRLLYGADFRLVGRLVDHNTHKRGMGLPERGRILTLLTAVQEVDPIMQHKHGGVYELDLWLPPEHYGEIPWGSRDNDRRVGDQQGLVVFASSCEGMKGAPPGVKYLIVSARPRTYSAMLYREIEPIRDAVRPVEKAVLDLTWDQYALRRAERELRS